MIRQYCYIAISNMLTMVSSTQRPRGDQDQMGSNIQGMLFPFIRLGSPLRASSTSDRKS